MRSSGLSLNNLYSSRKHCSFSGCFVLDCEGKGPDRRWWIYRMTASFLSRLLEYRSASARRCFCERQGSFCWLASISCENLYPTALAILIAKLSCLLIYSFKSRFFIFLSSKGKTLSLKFSQMRSPLFFTYQNSRRRCGASLVHSPTTHTVTPVPVWYILR